MWNAIKRVFWLLDEKNKWGSSPCDYINADKNIVDACKHINIQEAWDRIFEKGIGKSAHSVIVDIHSYLDSFSYMEKIKEKVVKSTGCSADTVHTIFSDEALAEIWNLSLNSTQSYVVVIRYVGFVSEESKRMVYDILERDNMTVIAIIVASSSYSIFDTLISHGVENLLIRGITSPLESQYYTGIIGTETLGRGEYLFKHGNELYIAEKDE